MMTSKNARVNPRSFRPAPPHTDAAPTEKRRLRLFSGATLGGLVVGSLLLITGFASRYTLAIGATAAAWCYMAAAATGRPWIAWASIPGASLVVVVSELLGFAWWVGLVVVGFALVASRLHTQKPAPLLAQAAAFTAIGAIAVVALSIDPRTGVLVAGLLLASHALWDWAHLRRGWVVPRSMAEACFSFDLVLGLGLIAITFLAP